MEVNSPQIEPTVNSIEAKCVSGLSTIMVATIQEAKDRISQIEYIFCSQLFPTFQSNSKTLQKVYSEALKAAEDAWKETERNLLCEIEELKLEKQKILAENQALKLEKENQSEELGKTTGLLVTVKSQQEKIEELRSELKKKSREADEGMELHNRLVLLVQAKTSDVVNKDKRLKEHEEEINMLLAQVKSLERKVDFLQEELSKKTLVTENLLKKLEFLSAEAASGDQKLNDIEEENQKLKNRLEIFKENVGRLEELLRKKTDELEERRKILEGLHQKLNLTETEMLKSKQQLIDHEKEKKLLKEKVKSLEEEVNDMHLQLKKAAEESGESEALCQQAEQMLSELAMQRKRTKDAYDAYKRLKSQYNFLLKSCGLTTDTIPPQDKCKDETNQLGQPEGPPVFHALENTAEATCGADNAMNGSGEKENVIKMVQVSASSSAAVNFASIQKGHSGGRSARRAGTKRPASSWRDTRSRTSPGAFLDPHDDFLDTPLENLRKENKEVGDAENKRDDSDDETQDMNATNSSPSKQRIQVVGLGTTSEREFKYVEGVRKKAEREKLKGIECKQCKKFYDAVLPVPENEGSGGRKSLRCEHHEGVSRHRYKYVPPLTPEGFWNIGFESEM